jgi:radical SAM protein, TIGR01212 family
MINCWNGRPYYSLSTYLKEQYGEKIYKLSLSGNMTCPNRDGTLSHTGCIFCSEGGSGDFSALKSLRIHEQIQHQKNLLKNKTTGNKFIGYFQSFTNTYAPVEYLESLFMEAILHPEIIGLSIGTRPDCLSDDILKLLERLNSIKPVWVELGLQSIHEKTALVINRGYTLPIFDKAVADLNELNIPVIVHTILGLPYETPEQIRETILYLNHLNISGIKLQLLHILKNTPLAILYQDSPFPVYTLEEYLDILIMCVEHLSPAIVIHRLTGDGPKRLLVAPSWSSNKKLVLNTMNQEFLKRNTWQGRLYSCS